MRGSEICFLGSGLCSFNGLYSQDLGWVIGLKAYPFSGERSTSSISPGVEGVSMLATVLRGRFKLSEAPLMRIGGTSGGVAGECSIRGVSPFPVTAGGTVPFNTAGWSLIAEDTELGRLSIVAY